uniref:Methyltransferase domain-containing protein n=1 Tax=Ditylum brightwellii TaxID=49249 RepID=A0A7S2ESF1_9STRA
MMDNPSSSSSSSSTKGNASAARVEIYTQGIDVRPKLVREMNTIVSELPSSTFQDLTFVEGTIESVLMDCCHNNNNNSDNNNNNNYSDMKKKRTIDILIALHACDTATDDALWYGLQSQSSIIVVAPCCHKEIRRQFYSSSSSSSKHPYKSILRHNIYSERIAEIVTDSLRALLLEYNSYDVNVFEFVGGEHTAKNVMIVGTKRKRKRSGGDLRMIRKQIVDLVTLHGITKQRLATWMDFSLLEEDQEEEVVVVQEEGDCKKGCCDEKEEIKNDLNINDGNDGVGGKGNRKRAISPRVRVGQMPPL